jgi:3-oxoacyl-[acyl-carrier protein] reductase
LKRKKLHMLNSLNLTSKVALVTGASSGIGAATAMVLAELGARVAIGYYQNEAGADRVQQAIIQRAGKAIRVRVDARVASDIRELVRRSSDELGPIDILINNAGSLIERMRVVEQTEERWDEVMNLNLKSAMLCSQAVAESMMARKTGAIVNVGSIAGRTGGGLGAAAYSVAKGGLITFTKSLARELAPHGIRVNAVSPGVIDTPFHQVFSTPEMIRNFVASIPLGRIGTPEECARVIAFLATDAASYVVGETVEINGGQLML